MLISGVIRTLDPLRQVLCEILLLLQPRGTHIYNFIYNGFSRHPKNACNLLLLLVRPAGLEPATTCLEGGFWGFR
jgi:hypothetical protein